MKLIPFNAFVGSASGILKGALCLEKGEVVAKNLDSVKGASNKNPITCMCWGDEQEEEILMGYSNHCVKIYNTKSRAFTVTDEKNCGDGSLVGVCRANGVLVTAVDSGMIKVWQGDSPRTFEAGKNLDRMRHHKKDKAIVATGGKDNDIKLFDIENGKQVFCAKNVRHDELELQVPVWVTDLAFLDQTRRVAVTTRHGHVRLYDPLSGARKPVVNVQVPEQSLTCMSNALKDNHVIVGSGGGQMNLVDLRGKGLVMNKYKGFVGGIRGIACSQEEPYVASVSLDRHFRVHHLTTKELVIKEYMQSKLNCVLVRSKFDLIPKEPQSGSEEEVEEKGAAEECTTQEFDEIFQQMPAVGGKKSKSGGSPRKKQRT